MCKIRQNRTDMQEIELVAYLSGSPYLFRKAMLR